MYEFIGIDVSKDKLDLCWLRNNSGKTSKSKVFKNQHGSFAQLAAWIKKATKLDPDDICITLEATGVYHESLVYFLYEQGFQIFLANPGKAKKYADAIGLTHKTDKIDSYMLAKFGHAQCDSLKLWKPDPIEVRELKSLLSRLNALEKDRQREKNRLESSEFNNVSERVILSLKDMIKTLDEEINKLKKDIDDHIDKYPNLRKNNNLMKSIVGVGDVIAREMTYIFAAKCFKNAKEVAAYLGLIPKIRESGKQKGKVALSKAGSSRIRAKLYMAAVSASTYNEDIKAQKRRLLAKGKTKMQALGAAMRKLVQICFGVVKNETEYKPQVAMN